MLYRILFPLNEWISALNVFRYITFRSALAALTAMVISFGLGGFLIRKLRELQWGQEIREEGPSAHRAKAGTPTMGGILIITAVAVPTLLWADLKNIFVWISLYALLAFGLIGFMDDYLKIARKRNLGLTTAGKLLAQIIVAVSIGVAVVSLAGEGVFDTRLSFPFFKALHPELGWLYVGVVLVVVVGSSNAVNLTDGLDGLAIGSVLIASATFVLLTYVAGHAVVAEYLGISNVKGAGELSVFCSALVGASLGFLWFNCNPAQIFMGDTGSMALGGSIGTVAVLIKQEILLVLVGGLFVMEALSVIFQVASFKMTGRRIFKMAPIHHHFEQAGWAEPKIVIRFWILAIIFALLSLSTLKLR
jgi:phospho-N-acetylmuramoyl-pentapeptide-transferase